MPSDPWCEPCVLCISFTVVGQCCRLDCFDTAGSLVIYRRLIEVRSSSQRFREKIPQLLEMKIGSLESQQQDVSVLLQPFPFAPVFSALQQTELETIYLATWFCIHSLGDLQFPLLCIFFSLSEQWSTQETSKLHDGWNHCLWKTNTNNHLSWSWDTIQTRFSFILIRRLCLQSIYHIPLKWYKPFQMKWFSFEHHRVSLKTYLIFK